MNIKVSISLNGISSLSMSRCMNISENEFQAVLPIFLATKAPISLSNVAQRAQLKFFNVAM